MIMLRIVMVKMIINNNYNNKFSELIGDKLNTIKYKW